MSDRKLRERVVQRLLAASDAKLTAEDIDDSTSLREDLDMSSLILVTLASEFEHEAGIEIDDDQLSGIETVGDLLRAIENSPKRNRSA